MFFAEGDEGLGVRVVCWTDGGGGGRWGRGGRGGEAVEFQQFAAFEGEGPDVEQVGVRGSVSAMARFVAWGEERDGGVAVHVEEGLVLEGDLHGRCGAGSWGVRLGFGLGGGIGRRGGFEFGAAAAEEAAYATPGYGACGGDADDTLSWAATFFGECGWW